MTRHSRVLSPNPPMGGGSIGCRHAVLFGSILLAMTFARGDDDLPKQVNFDRYKGMLDHSPFAVATAVVAPAATPNFAKDLYVANAARLPDGDSVTIASSADKEFKRYLTTKEPVDGYAIANIEWSDKVGETKVTISKDGQFATLTFNQALISTPLPNRLPGQPVPAPPPAIPRIQKPMTPGATATPHIRGIIQRNPQLPTPAARATSFPISPTPPPTADDE